MTNEKDFPIDTLDQATAHTELRRQSVAKPAKSRQEEATDKTKTDNAAPAKPRSRQFDDNDDSDDDDPLDDLFNDAPV